MKTWSHLWTLLWKRPHGPRVSGSACPFSVVARGPWGLSGLAGLGVLAVPGGTVLATPPPLVYEGHLERDEAPLDGDVTLGFAVTDAEAEGAGTTLCEDVREVHVAEGWFVATIEGTCTPALAMGGGERWLHIRVDVGQPEEQAMPAQRIGAVPYAYAATRLVDENGDPRVIEEDLELQVVPCLNPGDARFCNIPEALAWLRNKQVLSGGTVTIRVADGVYEQDATIVLDHNDGRRMELVGNRERPENVVLNFPDTDGIAVASGTQWGLIAGFRLVNTAGVEAAGAPMGLRAGGGSEAAYDALVIEAFDWGLYTSRGQLVRAQVGPSYVHIIGVRFGVTAAHGGLLNADGRAEITATEWCGYATGDSHVAMDGAICAPGVATAFAAALSGYLRALLAEAQGPTSFGFVATYGGYMYITGARVTGGAGTPYSVDESSSMRR